MYINDSSRKNNEKSGLKFKTSKYSTYGYPEIDEWINEWCDNGYIILYKTQNPLTIAIRGFGTPEKI
ncbi:MAG: hypothetical protein LBD23_14990 [Oscillospiraceae bacterium]|nr:hypothetical protein [Oscillospiraceae bacterium]